MEIQSQIKKLETELKQESSLSLPRVEETFHDSKQTKIRFRKTFNEKNNLHSFSDQPALIKYDKNGTPECMEWYVEGKLSRKTNPARIWFFSKKKSDKIVTGIKGEEYYSDGEYHREKEPAIIFYYQNGEIENFEYWEKGKHIPNPLDKHKFDRGMKKNLVVGDKNPENLEDFNFTTNKVRNTDSSIKGKKITTKSFKEVKELLDKYDPEKQDK